MRFQLNQDDKTKLWYVFDKKNPLACKPQWISEYKTHIKLIVESLNRNKRNIISPTKMTDVLIAEHMGALYYKEKITREHKQSKEDK